MTDIPLAPDTRTAVSDRTVFLDNLKAFLTVLVVMHHAGQAYGPTGGAWPILHAEKFRLLGPFFHINASFFMGLFFLISGYFLPAAYDRHGPAGFLRARLMRLGMPVLLFGGVFVPLARHFVYGKDWAQCLWPFEWAHLWFLGHLLVYSVAYVLYRAVWRSSARRLAAPVPFPDGRHLLAYAIVLALASSVVRVWFPIDVWVHIGVPAELAHVPQYLSLFLLGMYGASHHWLERIPAATGWRWLAGGAVLIAWRFGYTLVRGEYLSEDVPWVHFIWSQWEALVCVCLCVGLPFAFQRYGNNTQPWARLLARHAFLVYVLHLPVLVFLQMALENVALSPLALMLLSGSLTLVLCYGLGGWVRAASASASP